jgi:hypothetical protein
MGFLRLQVLKHHRFLDESAAPLFSFALLEEPALRVSPDESYFFSPHILPLCSRLAADASV